jgi:hypothetical protein
MWIPSYALGFVIQVAGEAAAALRAHPLLLL